MRLYLLILLTFLTSALAATECDLKTRSLTHETISVERAYAYFKPNARGYVPRNKVFQYWRERTPPWIPDSAFLWHFVDESNVQTVGVKLASPEPVIKAGETVPTIRFSENGETEVVGLNTHHWVREGLEYVADVANDKLPENIKQERTFDPHAPRYIFFELDGAPRLVLFATNPAHRRSEERISHQIVWAAVKRAHPAVTLISAGILLFKIDYVDAAASVSLLSLQPEAYIAGPMNKDISAVRKGIEAYLRVGVDSGS